eukprot:844788-Amphidinium_carterae.1
MSFLDPAVVHDKEGLSHSSSSSSSSSSASSCWALAFKKMMHQCWSWQLGRTTILHYCSFKKPTGINVQVGVFEWYYQAQTSSCKNGIQRNGCC